MTFPVLIVTLLTSALAVGIVKRRSPRKRRAESWFDSPVGRQHWQLYRGGALNPHHVKATKQKFQESLELGQLDYLAHRIEAGPEFVVQIRALAEIGTEAAAAVLEKQIHRTLSHDPIEECWYSIDLAHSLRTLNRCEALPQLLRRSRALLPLPMGHLFAAELVAYPNFGQHLDYPLATMGQAGLRTLYHVLRGVRQNLLPVQLFVDANLGEVLNRLIRSCPGSADPLVSLVFLEILRLRRRSFELAATEPSIRWRINCLQDFEPIVREYLHGIGEDLIRTFDYVSVNEQADYLQALYELRTDFGGPIILKLAGRNGELRRELLRCLRWSKHPGTVEYLTGLYRESQGRCNSAWWKRWDRDPTASREFLEEQAIILEALADHPDEASEALLLETALTAPTPMRQVAIKSLGWWEPIRRGEVLNCLHVARLDTDGDIRIAAIMALARLGEVAALQQIRESLRSESPERVHESIEWIAEAGLSWLWCELDELTDCDDRSVSAHACDALERLRERLFGPLG
jgi:hypothetical protein